MRASLPMYLVAETKAAHNALWAGIRDRLRDEGLNAPKHLDHHAPLDLIWGSKTLALGHICNLPYRLRYRDKVTLIGASDYGLDGCPPGYYRSLFVVREDHPAEIPEDLDGATMAYSDEESQSGWGAAAIWARTNGIRIRPVSRTASHANAMTTVLAGSAEFASIDAKTFEILKQTNPATQYIRVIGATEPTPGITFITRKGQDPSPYQAAITGALADLAPRHAETLGLRGVVPLPTAAYDLPIPPDPGAFC